jgi:hypothetical protein
MRDNEVIEPLPGEVAEARRQRGGWIYRIAGNFSPSETVPPTAIAGAWKIDDAGNIVGDFLKNPNYDPERFPPPEPADG